MNKAIYVVRHCEAQGQPSESQLTEKGQRQADQLADFFSNVQIERILSSPFKRALQSAKPLSEASQVNIEVDQRLMERKLSSIDLPDWLEKLEATFANLALSFEGGESSQEAMNRVVDVVREVMESDSKNTMIVSHGNLISLLLHHFDKGFSFNDWKQLSYPDVFVLRYTQKEIRIERIWKENGDES